MPTTAASQLSPGKVAAARVGRLSSDSIPVGGFAPGMILISRYRIIGLLGRGGMGEVYRADDLKLGQPVALKFLPRALADDPVRRERFFAEVRITRGLAHPNICRVYDISEFEGQHFLSMEYIDGEDLASLIQRIGYLSNEKALDIARQLAAGLAAAHDRGVLHRDLKPANIMIDGHGRVRITDFGLAVAAGEETQVAQMYGTPAYMAPEQFTGSAASVRSDIYALGLVFYEIYSGKKAFKASNIAELRDLKNGQTPTAPSEIRQGIDPIVERVIMRCIERDAHARPAAAVQLLTTLPGGDPLAAAIASGETPSPEMVAASGLKEGLKRSVAWALLASVILLLTATVWVKERTDLFLRLKPSKSPEVLTERARDFIRKAGYAEEPADSEVAFAVDHDFFDYQADQKEKQIPIPWNNLPAISPTFFWYRQSPLPLERTSFLGALTAAMPMDPPLFFPGDKYVNLDTEGRLRKFRAVPPDAIPDAGRSATPDWQALFSAAGLDIAEWTPAEPKWNPESYADTRTAWEGSLPEAPGIPIRIEAAAYQGKPVSFTVAYPWTRLDRLPASDSGPYWKIFNIFGTVLLVTVVAGPVFVARQNLRLGRGDRRGANRMVVAMVLAPLTVAWILLEHHVSTFWELAIFVRYLAGTLLVAGLLWTLYIAIEPFVRRRWPQLLVSWTRLWSGEWTDPLVGRDVLIGCVVGIAFAWITFGGILLPAWIGGQQPPLQIWGTNPAALFGAASYIGIQATTLTVGTLLALAAFFLFLLLRTLLRRDWLTGAAWILILSLSDPTYIGAVGLWTALIVGIVQGVISLFVLMRFGLVSMTASTIVFALSSFFPITFDAFWYASYGYTTLGLILVIAFYGFQTSLAGQPMLTFPAMDTEPSRSRRR